MVFDWLLKKIVFKSVEKELRALGLQAGMHSAAAASNMIELARRAEEVLASIEVPGFDVDFLSTGAVRRIRVSRDGSKVAVFVDFTGSDPSCYYCKFINWSVWKSILGRAEAELKNAGFREVMFIDAATGAKIEY